MLCIFKNLKSIANISIAIRCDSSTLWYFNFVANSRFSMDQSSVKCTLMLWNSTPSLALVYIYSLVQSRLLFLINFFNVSSNSFPLLASVTISFAWWQIWKHDPNYKKIFDWCQIWKQRPKYNKKIFAWSQRPMWYIRFSLLVISQMKPAPSFPFMMILVMIIMLITVTIMTMMMTMLPDEPVPLRHHSVVVLHGLQLADKEVPGQHKLKFIGSL